MFGLFWNFYTILIYYNTGFEAIGRSRLSCLYLIKTKIEMTIGMPYLLLFFNVNLSDLQDFNQ